MPILLYALLAAVFGLRQAPSTEPVSRGLVTSFIVADGGNPAAAIVETLEWRRSARFTGVSIKAALIAGRYAIYAAGERKADPIEIQIHDLGTHAHLAHFVLGGGGTEKVGSLELSAPSICSIVVNPGQTVRARRVNSYDVSVAWLRRPR